MNIYIHIGTRKTGTSFIQRCNALNVNQLNECGYFWPKYQADKTPESHNKIFNLLLNQNVTDFKKIIDRNLKFAEESGYENMIFSSEALIRFEEKDIEHLISLLSGHQIKVILFVRNIYDYVKSDLQQLLHSYKRPFDSTLNLITESLDLDSIITRWENAEIVNDIDVIFYDKYKHKLYERFLQSIDMPTEKTSLFTYKNITVNQSLDTSTHLVLASIGFLGENLKVNMMPDKLITEIKSKAPPNQFFPKIVDMIIKHNFQKYHHPKLLEIGEDLWAKPKNFMTVKASREANDMYIKALIKFLIKIYVLSKIKAMKNRVKKSARFQRLTGFKNNR